jgi:hypothetical protein
MLKKSLLNCLILPFSLVPWLCVGTLFDSQANALPGQSTEEVGTWIKAHPTLRPRRGEQLFVQKTDTAAQRFTFQASVLPPGRVEFSKDRGTIRTERITMIYGLEIYQDYDRAQVVYQYPNQKVVNSARLAKTPIREALKGELRVGDRYVYWVEVAQPKTGKAFTGQMTVLLKTDLNKLENELQIR